MHRFIAAFYVAILASTPAAAQTPADIVNQARDLLKGLTTPKPAEPPPQPPSTPPPADTPQQVQQSQQPKPRETVRQVIDTSATSWDCYVSMKDGGTERFSVQAPSDKAAKEELHKKLGERAYAQFASCSPEDRSSSAPASATSPSVSAQAPSAGTSSYRCFVSLRKDGSTEEVIVQGASVQKAKAAAESKLGDRASKETAQCLLLHGNVSASSQTPNGQATKPAPQPTKGARRIVNSDQ